MTCCSASSYDRSGTHYTLESSSPSRSRPSRRDTHCLSPLHSPTLTPCIPITSTPTPTHSHRVGSFQRVVGVLGGGLEA